MSGAKVVTLAPKPIRLSNTDFLAGVFGPNAGRAHVTSFKPDPLTLTDRGLWGGGAAAGLLPFHVDWNTFFTISVFFPDPVDGRSRRRKVSFDRCHAIVIDDVNLRDEAGTSAKVPADRVKLDPSWVLETSPGNYQLGYILDGGDSRGGKVAALLDALVASGLVPDGSDPGMKGVTRYVRLPVGRNTKAKYGTAGFDHRLSGWHPSRVYRLEDVADAYGVRAVVDAAADDLGAAVGVGAFVPGEDALWNAILASGSAHSVDAQKALIHVTCPFVDEHTGGADSGTAYLGGGRWCCNHGHCVDRSYAEFSDRFKALFPEAWSGAVRESFEGLGGEDEAGVAPSVRDRELRSLFGDEAVDAQELNKSLNKSGTEDEVASALAGFWVKNRAAFSPDKPWLLKGLMPVEGVGVLYGTTGIGKSFVAYDLAARVSLGLDWRGHRVKTDGAVIYVASEGGTDDMEDRAEAWERGNGGLVPDVFMYPAALGLGAGAKAGRAKRFAELCAAVAAETGRRVALVVVDTVARNLRGDENSAGDMGAFVQDCEIIRRELGAFVLLIHHTGKDASKGPRGSSALPYAVDTAIRVEKEPGADGMLVIDKVRRGKDGAVYGYTLTEVVLGVDADGEEVGSLYAQSAQPPAKTAGPGARPRKISAFVAALIDTYMDLVGEDAWCDIQELANQTSARAKAGSFPGLVNSQPSSLHPSQFKRKINDVLLGKLGWEQLADAVKSGSRAEF